MESPQQPSVPPRSRERVFLGSYPYLFSLLLLGVNAGLFVLWLLLPFAKTGESFLRNVLINAAISLPICVVLTFFLTWMYRVRMTDEGIHGGTIWSTPVYMSFAEMETVEPRRICGMSYLRIRSFRESCPPLWLPRFLATPKAFQEAITEQTSSFHPLRRSLENGGTAENRNRLAL